MKTLTLLALPIVLASVAACGGDDKPPPKTPATQPVATQETTNGNQNKQMAVNVDEDIVKACNLKFNNVQAAPKFNYDSEALTPAEKDVLEAVAKCLTTGPLKGRSVELVGRADPRGETEYNMSLGARRAKSVNSYLSNLGVPGDKMRDTSRGELDATGKDEAGYQRDRRVDVKLIK